jgi:hypothetical protein
MTSKAFAFWRPTRRPPLVAQLVPLASIHKEAGNVFCRNLSLGLTTFCTTTIERRSARSIGYEPCRQKA